MSSFKIYNTISGSSNITESSILDTAIKNFNIMEYVQLYNDDWCIISWNPIYYQLSFTLLNHNNKGCRGGINILNSDKNSTKEFQYNGQNLIEYYFSSENGLENNIDNDYRLNLNWNRLTMWLGSILKSDFPYYNIKLFTNSYIGIIHIDKYDN